VRDEWIDITIGIFTLSRMCAACLLVHGDGADKKLLVHPESKIAVSYVVAVKINGVQSKANANLSNL
jgi:hypothetical protein